MAQYVSGRQPFINVGIPGITTNSPVMDITGRVGIGTTNPSADIDLSTIRIRQSIFDTNNFAGELGYFLTNDATGLKWVAVPPLNNNAIFISQNSEILGVSSYTGINFVSDGDDLVAISTNIDNTNIVDVRVKSRWNKDGNTGIYTSKSVGIGTTNPTEALYVVGNGRFSGIVTASKFSGQSGIITGTVEVGSLVVSGVSTFIGVTTFSKVGIGSTTIPRSTLDVGGDVWVSGAVTALSFTADNFYGTITTAKYADVAGIATNISIASTTSDDETSYLVLVGSSGTTIQQTFIDSQSLTYDGQSNTLNSDNIKVGFITATNAWIGVATINDLSIVNNVFRVGSAITMSNGIITATTFNGKFLDFENINVSGIATINIGIVTNLSISGITTINTGIVTNLKVSGVSTFVGLSTFGTVGIGTTNVIGSDVLTIIGDTRLGIDSNTFRVGSAITMSNGIITATTFKGRFLDFENINVSGIATINTGIVTNLKVSGVSTFVGIATFGTVGIGTTNVIGSDKLTIIGDARVGNDTNTFRVGSAITMSNGIITASTFSGKFLDFTNINVTGIATINTGIVTNLSVTGIATINIGIVTNLKVSGVSTFGNSTTGVLIDGANGIITSTNPGVTTVTYFGDGSNLTGVSGVKVKFLELTGDPVYPTLANSAGVSSVGIATTGDNALVFIPSTGRLGIGTTSPTQKLDVNGDIRLRAGLWDSNNVNGDDNNILVSTGSSVVWSTLNDIGGSEISLQEDNTTTTPQYLVFTPTTSGIAFVEKVSPSKLSFIASSGNLGIGTSLATERLEVYGNISINGTTSYGSTVGTSATTSQIGIHSGISTSTYRSVEYTIQATQGSNFHATKILSIHDGTAAYNSEYGMIFNNTSLGIFDVDVSGGNMRLLVTPASSSLTTYTINFVTTKI